jgi:hypothetical protein
VERRKLPLVDRDDNSRLTRIVESNTGAANPSGAVAGPIAEYWPFGSDGTLQERWRGVIGREEEGDSAGRVLRISETRTADGGLHATWLINSATHIPARAKK